MRIIVVGAGVIGLSCAIRLAERGFEVHVLARDLPPETTSAVAAALWYPYRVAPADGTRPGAPDQDEAARVLGWALATYAQLAQLAQDQPAAGVTLRWGVELLRQTAAQPWWRPAMPPDVLVGHVPPGELPAGYRDAWRVIVPVVDMEAYLCLLYTSPSPRDRS